ncbi:poly [ADP-ribose] polymerase [Sitodiplosis mosellana]|uniref:poly [ADP-ribose] polymerase n=1 Tax=Sitodiplosis mosellana TaxID=263140 RepID=UPI0024444ECC|nr:poly [ADP-ribose] polymerase [Sitodiplosis mosellana]
MSEELPYKCEYAKSGRAGCKGCKTNIAQGTLRIAVMVQSAFHDGKQPNWFHQACFFKKHRPATEALIDGFPKLRVEDQKEIRGNLGGGVTAVIPQPKKEKGKKRSVDPGTSKGMAMLINDFGIEYAKSGRASCAGCHQKIPKDEVRIKKVAHDTEIGLKFGGQALWHHVECFAQLRTALGWFESAEILPGFKSLSKDDKANAKKHIPAIKQDVDEPSLKKQKVDEVDSALEAKIEQQNKEYYKLRDKLESQTKKPVYIAILEANRQAIPEGNSEVLDHVTDVIYFGAIKPCTNCKNGNFIFGNTSYVCNGNLSEWAKCDNVVKEPERTQVKIPQYIKEEHSFLGKQFKVKARAVRNVPVAVQAKLKVKKEEIDDIDAPRVQREKPPLYNMEFVIVGKMEKSKEDIKKMIQKMGGKVGSKIHEKTVAVISTAEEVDRMGHRIKEAKEFGIQVVPVHFLDDAKTGNAVSLIISQSLCDWGTDPHARIPQDELKSKSKSIYTKSVPKSQKLKLKNGTAVDPDSKLEDIAHVYCEGKTKYFAILCNVDIAKDKNSYYKIQLLESDRDHRYWVFRSWGRISTTIGSTKLETYGSLEQAREAFEQIYEERTGNFFGEKKFVKYPGKYYKMDIDYGEEEEVRKLTESKIKSTLATPVQDLIKLLFDVNMMKQMMLEFDLDMEKMPLGKLSSKQIKAAMNVLQEIAELIQKDASSGKFVEASNRFYTMIPHDFGIRRPPILDSIEMVSKKAEMLESLLEMELAYGLLNEETDAQKNPLDAHYEQLKTDIVPINKTSDEYELLCRYVKNTHAPTHTNYSLEVEEIFKVVRKGEERRFKPFKKWNNRQLLWHGSRLTNYVGILSHGLKIAPPEAPVTGYMFGKGIYFADMVTKSANYCATTHSNNTGLMLLSEVALGDCLELNKADYIKALPNDKQSVKGLGKTYPDPAEAYKQENGVIVPIGKPIEDTQLRSDLLYNEYIVYDVAQVNIKYLFKMKFHYKR